jgi:hypothetical protein
MYMSRARMRVPLPGPPWVSTQIRSKYSSDPTSIRVEDVMIVYFSCGRVIEKN